MRREKERERECSGKWLQLCHLQIGKCSTNPLVNKNMSGRYGSFVVSFFACFWFWHLFHFILELMQSTCSIINRWLASFQKQNNHHRINIQPYAYSCVCLVLVGLFTSRCSALQLMRNESIYLMLRIWTHQKFKRSFFSIFYKV